MHGKKKKWANTVKNERKHFLYPTIYFVYVNCIPYMNFLSNLVVEESITVKNMEKEQILEEEKTG